MIGSRSAGLTSIGLGVGLALTFTQAHAQRQARDATAAVQVVAPACAAAAETFVAFVGALRVELTGPSLWCCAVDAPGDAPAPGAPAAASARVTLAFEPCERDAARVDVTVEGADAGDAIRRVIPLGDIPAATRPRALALAVAELVRSVTSSPRPAPVAGASPPPSPLERTGAPAPRSTLALGLGPELRVFPGHHTDLWGGRLSLGAARARWGAAVDVGADAGRARYDAGDVSVRLVTAAAAAGPRFDLGGAFTDIQACAALGWARVTGTSNQPGVIAGAGAGLVATVGARLAVEAPRGWPVRLRAALEAGTTLAGVHAEIDGARAAGASGFYVAVGVGGAVALGPR